MELFYILSLERSRRDHPYWWRPNKMGYTEDLGTAGKYTREEAQAIYNADIEHNDIPVPCLMVEVKNAVMVRKLWEESKR